MDENKDKKILEIQGLKERSEFLRSVIKPDVELGDDWTEGDSDFRHNHDDEDWCE